MFSSRKIALLLLVALLPLLMGCAFMNTLYNGWLSYKKAVKTEERMAAAGEDSIAILAQTEKDLQRAIDKAQKAIDYYPKASKSHDDAYYLKGLANFRKQNYSGAVYALEALQERYPESKYYKDSWLWLARAYAANEQYPEAEEALEFLLATYPSYQDHADVLMLRADIALNLQGKGEAIQILEARLKVTSDPIRRLYIIDRLGSLYLEMHQNEKAVKVLEQIPPFDRKHTALFFSAQYNLARAYNALEQFDKVADLLAEMSENNRYYTHRDKLQLFAGKVYLKQEQFDEAEKILLRLANGKGKTEYRAEAWFLVSGISIDIRGDLVEGEKQLTEAQKLATQEPLKGDIAQRLASLRTLAALQDTLTTADPDSIDILGTKYKIGEVYWLDAKLPDSALVYFNELLEDSTLSDTLRASALYAKAWILRGFKADSSGADSIYYQIIDEFPATEVAKQSQIELGVPVTVVTRRDSAWSAFGEAEDLYEKSDGGYNKNVYYAYLLSALKYADIEDVAAKGLYAAGIVANERYHGEDGTLDTATVKIFTRLCDRYPTSPQCKEIESRLSDEAVKEYSSAYKEALNKDSLTEETQDSVVALDSVQGDIFPTDTATVGAPEIPDFESWF